MESNQCWALHVALGILPESGPDSELDKLNEIHPVADCEAYSARTGSLELVIQILFFL